MADLTLDDARRYFDAANDAIRSRQVGIVEWEELGPELQETTRLSISAIVEMATAAERARREAAEADAAALRDALVEARAALDRDRTGLAAALNAVREEVRSRWWITEGRGSYEWNDDRYREETRHALEAIGAIPGPALAASGDIADAGVRRINTALATTAGAALLERLRAAEERGKVYGALSELGDALLNRQRRRAERYRRRAFFLRRHLPLLRAYADAQEEAVWELHDALENTLLEVIAALGLTADVAAGRDPVEAARSLVAGWAEALERAERRTVAARREAETLRGELTAAMVRARDEWVAKVDAMQEPEVRQFWLYGTDADERQRITFDVYREALKRVARKGEDDGE